MAKPSFQRHPRYFRAIADLVEREPDPPREVEVSMILSWLFRVSGTWIVAAFGVMCLGSAIGMYMTFRQGEEDLVLGYLLCALMASGGLLAVSAPWRFIRNQLFALRRGVLASARIDSVEPVPPVTFDGFTNGMVKGVRFVAGPRGTFTDPFSMDEPWGGRLDTGDSVRVLLHPEKDEVLIELPPESWEDSGGHSRPNGVAQ